MAYNKNTWKSGDVVTSAKLNNIENGIANASGKIDYTADAEEQKVILSASYNDVMAMIDNGSIPFIVMGAPDDYRSVVFVDGIYAGDDYYEVTMAQYTFSAETAAEPLWLSTK